MRCLRVLYLIGIVLLLDLGSCSKRGDISGVYVHSSGIKKYYILTISYKGGDDYFIKFEGVPLEITKTTEWQKVCNGKLKGSIIQCDEIQMEFSPSADTVSVFYRKNEKQIFINDKKEIEEEITLYKKGSGQMGKKPGEKTQ